LALPQTLLLEGLDATVSAAFARALSRLSAAGAELIELPLAEVREIATINQPVPLAAIEAYAVHQHTLQAQRERYDPRVAQRIAAGAAASAAEHATLLQRRQDWISRVTHKLHGFDALLCPTVPLVAPALAPLLTDDAAFFATNALLLRNPAVVNFLDGCAFSLPCHQAGELPVGLMLAAPAGHDAALAGVALAIEAQLH
jgi:aspartyl-tRNA(Asn)/glutamyl-tRNA(Gln) amidotransferase subunit A